MHIDYAGLVHTDTQTVVAAFLGMALRLGYQPKVCTFCLPVVVFGSFTTGVYGAPLIRYVAHMPDNLSGALAFFIAFYSLAVMNIGMTFLTEIQKNPVNVLVKILNKVVGKKC